MAFFPELQYNAPKIKSPFEIEAGYQQIQQGQNQNRLSQIQFQKAERDTAQENMLAGAYRDSYGADGKQDRRKLYEAIATGGGGHMLPGIQKGYNEADASGVKLENDRLTGQKLQGDVTHDQKSRAIAKLGGFIQDPGLSEDMLMADLQFQMQSGELKIEQAQGMASQIQGKTPEQLRQLLTQLRYGMMTPQQQVEGGNKERDFRQKTDELAYRQQHDTATLAQQRDNSLRTDSRARDFNATKVEENTLKREAKADTANLTKQSQLASFDTMIGTLDRIGKHPGLARSVGITGVFPTMPGSDSANFQAELETFQSQAFIPMVSQLKGMGALSDAEGKKLTAAVGALNPKMGEKAFRESVARITSEMTAAKNRVSGANNGTAPTDKTRTKADVQATARASGKTEAEVIEAYRAKGYQIK